jgi:hypothetical protein
MQRTIIVSTAFEAVAPEFRQLELHVRKAVCVCRELTFSPGLMAAALHPAARESSLCGIKNKGVLCHVE